MKPGRVAIAQPDAADLLCATPGTEAMGIRVQVHVFRMVPVRMVCIVPGTETRVTVDMVPGTKALERAYPAVA